VPRNRKKQSSAVRLVPALKAILLCVFVGGSAVGYVLQKNQVYELGRQMARREMLLERLKWENRLRANQLASLQMPQRLAERVKELGGESGEPAPVPSMGWFSVCKDPEGNDFGLWQNDTSAPSPTG